MFPALLPTGTVLDGLLERDAENPSSISASSKVPTTEALKSILQSQDGDDIEGLKNFAVAAQLDLKTIVLAGLQTLQSSVGSSIFLETINSRHMINPQSQLSQKLSSPVPFLPSPLSNGIFLRQQAVHEIYDQNARSIGLSLEQIMSPDCASPFNTSFLNPYRPTGATPIPPDLYPTPSQTHFTHHPFIDLIPFPWFRDRVIALGSLDPPAFSRAGLKVDILNGGLTCWKSRARCMGQPWDRRSWEVAAWFLEKWGWLIEEKGWVEEQSRWWKGLRGR